MNDCLISCWNKHFWFFFSKQSPFFSRFVYLSINLFIAVTANQRKLLLLRLRGLTNQFSYIYICACFLKYICTLVCVCECVYSCSSCFMNHSHSLGNAYIWVCLLLQHFIKLLIPTDTWDAQRKVNGSFSCLKWKQNICSDICPKLQA